MSFNHEDLRCYLLGESPDEEPVEQSYFSDPEQLTELWLVFDQIAENYRDGSLAEEERQRFEQRLIASPALRRLLENDSSLIALASPPARTGLIANFEPASAVLPWRQRLLASPQWKWARLLLLVGGVSLLIRALTRT
jgi:hypothetical protein